MFEKVEVPVLGVVENMSLHICSECGHEETDSGKPTVVAEPDSRISQIYREIARRAAAKLSLKARSYAQKFPKIVIQNN